MPRQSYARVISSVDDHIGRVLDKLEATGLRDRTIVILMSDNGHSEENNAGIAVDDHSSGYPRGHYYLAHGGGGNTGKWIGHKGTFLEGGHSSASDFKLSRENCWRRNARSNRNHHGLVSQRSRAMRHQAALIIFRS